MRRLTTVTAAVILLFAAVLSFTTLLGIKPLVAIYVAGWTLAALASVVVALAAVFMLVREFDR